MAWVQVAPWFVDLYSRVPPEGVVSYSSPLRFAAIVGSPPNGPTFASSDEGETWSEIASYLPSISSVDVAIVE